MRKMQSQVLMKLYQVMVPSINRGIGILPAQAIQRIGKSIFRPHHCHFTIATEIHIQSVRPLPVTAHRQEHSLLFPQTSTLVGPLCRAISNVTDYLLFKICPAHIFIYRASVFSKTYRHSHRPHPKALLTVGPTVGHPLHKVNTWI